MSSNSESEQQGEYVKYSNSGLVDGFRSELLLRNRLGLGNRFRQENAQLESLVDSSKLFDENRTFSVLVDRRFRDLRAEQLVAKKIDDLGSLISRGLRNF